MSISLHPGTISSDLARNAGLAMKIFGRLITYPTSYGAITSLYAGTTPAAAELNGKVGIILASGICPWLVNLFTRNQKIIIQYLTAWARVTPPHKKALDPELEKKLWEWCEEQVKDI